MYVRGETSIKRMQGTSIDRIDRIFMKMGCLTEIHRIDAFEKMLKSPMREMQP
jgi:hypothetical protein